MSGADVVAEGVETAEQYDFIKQAGCDLIQGFYFYEALNAAEITALLQGKEVHGGARNSRQVA
jgi:diguanylate cyclase